MKIDIKDYKLVANYDEWVATHNPDKVYCITSGDGDELFDVYEDDFITMIDLGIVNSDGFYYLLGNPDEDTIKEYAKLYGIKWL